MCSDQRWNSTLGLTARGRSKREVSKSSHHLITCKTFMWKADVTRGVWPPALPPSAGYRTIALICHASCADNDLRLDQSEGINIYRKETLTRTLERLRLENQNECIKIKTALWRAGFKQDSVCSAHRLQTLECQGACRRFPTNNRNIFLYTV